MRYSMLFGKTLREKPRNADALSHQLLLRSGFVRPAAARAGFNLLPLAARVLDKIRAPLAAELAACALQPFAPPNGTHSSSSDAKRELRFQRRDGGLDYPWAEAHESVFASLEGSLALSYRELPLGVSTERWAVRSGGRLNWGLLLAPEFLAGGVYLFAASRAELDARAAAIETAYSAFASRVGLDVSWLESADGKTPEMVVATSLAARPVLACDRCGRQADRDEAVSRVPEWPVETQPGEMRAVYGPGLINVEPLAQLLGIPVHQTTKTLLFEAGGRIIAACVAGVYDVSKKKLARALGVRDVSLAPPERVRELTKAEVGYAGPIGLPDSVEVVWDLSTERRVNFEAGANRTDHHLVNVNFGRDTPRPHRFADIRVSKPGERCVQCDGGALKARNVIALAHTSRIGAIYAEPLGAMFLDSDGSAKPLEMACAGIDLTASVAAIAEQHHDDRGILWPSDVAPFSAHLVSLPPADAAGLRLYERLRAAGVDVLWDDRPESAGVKFGDADLIGIPIRLVVSKRTGDHVEWKPRAAETSELLSEDAAIDRLTRADILAKSRSTV